jgi:thiamine-phosphate pyrophosphorylase
MKAEPTPALLTALRRAQEIAARAGDDAASPAHLLHGLIAEDEGKPTALLLDAGADPAKLRAAWPPYDEDTETPSEADAIPWLQECRDLMNLAREVSSVHTDEGSLSTDRVLLALLQNDDDLRAQLETYGLDLAKLRFLIVGDETPLALDVPLDLDDRPAPLHAARILDACANRAREALRVLEDYVRFVLDDAFLSSQLKQARHDLADALALLPCDQLLDARDTPHDVGASISTPQEMRRDSLRDVAQANFKRLQESLRSLEEFGKIAQADFARRIEQIRYRAYTLEKALLRRDTARLADARLCALVTDALCRSSLVGTVKEALLGGATIVQLREKSLDDRTFLRHARELRKLTRDHGALLIVNDRPDLALLSEADGVHLGQDDLPLHEARKLLGPDAIIGASTHDLAQLRQAVVEGASYVGVGPTFPSRTKEFDTFAGLAFVQAALAETSLPAFAIGGIDLHTIAQARSAGARRVAVSHAVCAATDPRAAVRDLLAALQG